MVYRTLLAEDIYLKLSTIYRNWNLFISALHGINIRSLLGYHQTSYQFQRTANPGGDFNT